MRKVKPWILGLTAVVIVFVLSVGVSTAQSEKFPTKPIVLIAPWGAGGGSDALARTLSARSSGVERRYSLAS